MRRDRRPRLAWALSLCFLFGAGGALAHHSFSAQYDASKRSTIKGMVTKFEWRNPHVYFFMDVIDESGNVTEWSLEMANISAMRDRGWSRDTLQVGDMLEVEGARARDDSPLINVNSVVRIDSGEELLSER